jgi:phosphoglycolate phosphatase-like HAD superfamily hydrolase
MLPRLILFDIDGTLVDTAGAGRRALEQVFHDRFGVDAATQDTSRVRFAGMTDIRIFESLAEVSGIPPERFVAALPALSKDYLQALEGEMGRPDPRRRILPGIVPLLETLSRRADARLGLVTGNLEAGARIKLEPFGLNPYFPGGGFGSDHPDRREVARKAWVELVNISGIPFPASCVTVVGDTEHDVDCARANGFRAIAVESGWVSREVLEASGPDALFRDLTDRQKVLEALLSEG